MKWIKLKDRQPDVKIDGEKVLIYRVVNEDQKAQAITIHPTRLMINCNPNETWWMSLPENPNIEL